MARLSAQLKYLIAKKVSEDADWRGVEIVLSGHEVSLRTPSSSLRLTRSNNRSREKENIKLWNTFDFRKLSLVTIPMFDIVSTDSTPISSCLDY